MIYKERQQFVAFPIQRVSYLAAYSAGWQGTEAGMRLGQLLPPNSLPAIRKLMSMIFINDQAMLLDFGGRLSGGIEFFLVVALVIKHGYCTADDIRNGEKENSQPDILIIKRPHEKQIDSHVQQPL